MTLGYCRNHMKIMAEIRITLSRYLCDNCQCLLKKSDIASIDAIQLRPSNKDENLTIPSGRDSYGTSELESLSLQEILVNFRP